uniref:Uncharacterized protein n=1 Tax=Tetranychus urticae TaxID=32264 RepID=T1KCD1_TETUR
MSGRPKSDQKKRPRKDQKIVKRDQR